MSDHGAPSDDPTNIQWLKNLIDSIEGDTGHKALRSLFVSMFKECHDEDVIPIVKGAIAYWERKRNFGRN